MGLIELSMVTITTGLEMAAVHTLQTTYLPGVSTCSNWLLWNLWMLCDEVTELRKVNGSFQWRHVSSMWFQIYCNSTSSSTSFSGYQYTNKGNSKTHYYHQTSNIRHTLVGNELVDHSGVVRASPVGAAPTTSSFSTWHLASTDWAKTTARRDENHIGFDIKCHLYELTVVICEGFHKWLLDSPGRGPVTRVPMPERFHVTYNTFNLNIIIHWIFSSNI